MGKLDSWAKSFTRSCLSKKAYRTSEYAREVAKKVFKERGVMLYCYYCRECGMFHLTKRLPKNLKETGERIF